MDRFLTLSAVIASLLAVALASPAGAVEKCKARVDKKTGAIGYYFKYGGEGSVGVAYSNHGPPSTHTEDQEVFAFANEESCQQKGSGKACQVSSIPDVAAIAPTNCKAYLYDESDDTVCEVRVPGCQPALRPLPTSGYYCIENNHETTAVWDAATGHAWHISSDHQPRSLDDHHEHLLHLNGDHVDPEDTEHTPLVDGGDLELPTLHQLKLLAGDCAALFSELGGVGGTPSSEQECLHTLCTELWPDPASTDNCAWSATRDATQPETHAHAVCLNAATPPVTPSGAQENRPGDDCPNSEQFASCRRASDDAVWQYDEVIEDPTEVLQAALPSKDQHINSSTNWTITTDNRYRSAPLVEDPNLSFDRGVDAANLTVWLN